MVFLCLNFWDTLFIFVKSTQRTFDILVKGWRLWVPIHVDDVFHSGIGGIGVSRGFLDIHPREGGRRVTFTSYSG